MAHGDFEKGFIQASLLQGVDGVVHGFGVGTTLLGEQLAAIGMRHARSFQTEQVHGRQYHLLGAALDDRKLIGDAFLATEAGIVCHVRTADCVPILIAEKEGRGVAAVHAGWRGLVGGVIQTAVGALQRECQMDPSTCVAAIGPRICASCYQVGADVIESFRAAGIDAACFVEGNQLDLGYAARSLLLRSGCDPANIEILSACTSCHSQFVSWRRDHTQERQMSFIARRMS